MDAVPVYTPSGPPPSYQELNIEVYEKVWIGPVDDPEFFRDNNVRLMICFHAATVVYDIDEQGVNPGLRCLTGATRMYTNNQDPDCIRKFSWLCNEVHKITLAGKSVLIRVREDEDHDAESISRAYAFEEAWRMLTNKPRSQARKARETDLEKVLEPHRTQLKIWEEMMNQPQAEARQRIYDTFRADLEKRAPVGTFNVNESSKKNNGSEKDKGSEKKTEKSQNKGSSEDKTSGKDQGSKKAKKAKKEKSSKKDHSFGKSNGSSKGTSSKKSGESRRGMSSTA